MHYQSSTVVHIENGRTYAHYQTLTVLQTEYVKTYMHYQTSSALHTENVRTYVHYQTLTDFMYKKCLNLHPLLNFNRFTNRIC